MVYNVYICIYYSNGAIKIKWNDFVEPLMLFGYDSELNTYLVICKQLYV